MTDIFDNASNAFSDITNTVSSTLASKKKMRVKNNQNNRNWTNYDILKAIRTRDRYIKLQNAEQYCFWQNKNRKYLSQFQS